MVLERLRQAVCPPRQVAARVSNEKCFASKEILTRGAPSTCVLIVSIETAMRASSSDRSHFIIEKNEDKNFCFFNLKLPS